MEWQNGSGWKGSCSSSTPGQRDTFCQTRLLKSPSKPAWNVSGNAASPASLRATCVTVSPPSSQKFSSFLPKSALLFPVLPWIPMLNPCALSLVIFTSWSRNPSILPALHTGLCQSWLSSCSGWKRVEKCDPCSGMWNDNPKCWKPCSQLLCCCNHSPSPSCSAESKPNPRQVSLKTLWALWGLSMRAQILVSGDMGAKPGI